MIAALATTFPGASVSDPSPAPQNIYEVPDFAPLHPGQYSIEPDYDSPTSPRVLYTITAPGWTQWIGAWKDDEGPGNRGVGISIAVVTNLVTDGCNDHGPLDPSVGPTVDDLATALAALEPFEVSEPPSAVTIYGYRGTHLTLTIPEMPHDFVGGEAQLTDCPSGVKSWIAPPLSYAFYGYTRPGQIEEFWILEVERVRLMISAIYFLESPHEHVTEMHAILDSIQIEP